MTSHSEQPGHRTNKTLERVKYDRAEIERENRRKRVEAIPQETRWKLDESLAKRTPMQRIKRDS